MKNIVPLKRYKDVLERINWQIIYIRHILRLPHSALTGSQNAVQTLWCGAKGTLNTLK